MNDETIIHVGTSLASGRYPKGSGEDPFQHGDESFLSRVSQFRKQGMNKTEIAKAFGMSTASYLAKLSEETNAKKQHDIALVQNLRDKGMSVTAIAERTGLKRTTIDGWLKGKTARNASVLQNTANALKDEVDSGKFVNVSSGAEVNLGVTSTRLKNAVKSLEADGYSLHQLRIKEIFTNNTRTVSVLCPPGTTARDAWDHRFEILPPGATSEDYGETFKSQPKASDIKNYDSSKIAIRYAEEGGTEKDGVIELRRNVEGLSLGSNTYAQVRIGVDGTHYLKGMAVYADDLPDGVDIRFNTNKHIGTPMCGTKDNTVLKPQKTDSDNPFGADTRQLTAKGYGEYINVVNEEGDWAGWSKTLASQFLSKQPVSLAKKQLNLAYSESYDEFDEIKNLTNDVIKKKLLNEFAENCDKKAVTLKAAALPRQATHVILPVESLSDKEIYAPRYQNGEEVILVRFPHAGTFEIPKLTVNNKNAEAKRVITSNAVDAVGINAKTAGVLSGADFDGDTVLVIPTKNIKVNTKEPFSELKNFDPKAEYPKYEGMKVMSPKAKGLQMGMITNLITDMQVKGASDDELVRAVKHSMVVIDAEKHELDYKRSEKENRIEELRKIYQPSSDPDKPNKHSAATLLSRAKNPIYVDARRRAFKDDPETGEKIFNETHEKRKDYKSGEWVTAQTKTTQMYEAKDAYTLSSGRDIENAYAAYANKMKSLANQARKEALATPTPKYNADMAKVYKNEVDNLNRKLLISKANRPKEATAFLIAKQILTNQVRDNPELMDDADAYKKAKTRAVRTGRERVGSKREAVTFTDKEWEAVMAGAISASKLKELLLNSDSDQMKQLAMPRTKTSISSAKIQRAKNYLKAGYTWSEIAERLGYSESTLIKAVNKE